MLKYKYIFQINYTVAILSNSTRKLLRFEITKMLIAVSRNKFIVIFGTLSFPLITRTTLRYIVLYTLAMALCLYVRVVSLSQVDVLLKRLDGSSWFSHRGCYQEIRVSPKCGYFPLELCPELCTQQISPRHVDRRKVLSTKLVDGRAMLITLATVDAPGPTVTWRAYFFLDVRRS